MRMWMVNPAAMCRKHLLGEHVELHMLAGTLRKGIHIHGYVDNNLVEPQAIVARHEMLAAEILRRGYNHRSPLYVPPQWLDHLEPREKDAVVARGPARDELYRRCEACRLCHFLNL